MPYIKKKFGTFWVPLSRNPTPNEIAARILELAENKNKMTEITEQAYKIVYNNFLVDKMAKNWSKLIYRSLGLPLPIELRL